MNIDSLEISHAAERSSFLVVIEGAESNVRYEETPEALNILSTFVDPKHRGKGVAAKLTEAALAYADSKGLKIIPTCSYTAAYLKRKKSNS